MKIEKNATVELTYVLKDSEGNILEDKKDQITKYIHGINMMPKPVEDALQNKEAGAAVSVTVEPKDAYGEADESLIMDVPISNFQTDQEIKVGDIFETSDPEGNPFLIKIIEINGDQAKIDANHPFAGKTVTFELEVKNVLETPADALERITNSINGECSCGCGCDCGCDDRNSDDCDCDDNCGCGCH